jgi:adenine-specific DNA-methyltransferase
MQQPLFKDNAVAAPPTEGIKYAGSKLKLLPHILRLAGDVNARTIFDCFAGSTRVSQALAKLGYRVIANDIAAWSKVFAHCYLKNQKSPQYYREIIDHLNALPGVDGWFTEHYGGIARQPSAKKPWQIHNTRRLDAIREEIDNLRLPEVETSVLLTSLMLALDEVDSTLGHFASYLNDWSPRSYRAMTLRVPALIETAEPHEVFQKNIFDLCDDVACDLAYMDPPYGSNNEKMPPSRVRYAAYYHLWTTICLNDRPELFGKANRRRDSSDTVSASVFEDFRRGESGRFVCVEAIEKLISRTRAGYILLSYSSGGRATSEELMEVLSQKGRVIEVMRMDYRRNVMARMRWTNEWVRASETPNVEYLFLLEKLT